MNLINKIVSLSVAVHFAIASLLFCIFFYLGYSMFIAETLVSYNSLVIKQAQLQKQYKSTIQKYKAIALYKDRESSLLLLNNKLYNYIPEHNNMANLLITINQFGEDSSVNILSFQPDMVLDYSPLVKFQVVHISASANYIGLISFINRIGQLELLTSIDNLQVSNTGDSDKLKINFDLRDYFSS